MSKESRLVKNTLILSIGTFATKVLSFVIVPLFSGKMSLSDFGQWDLFYTYISLLIPIASISVGEGVFRYLLDADTEEQKKSIITSGFITFIIGNIICSVLIITFADFELKPYFVLLFLVSSCYEFVSYVLRGLKQLKTYTISGIVYTILMSIFSITLLYGFDFGVRALYIGYSLAYVIAILIICKLIKFAKYISLKNMDKELNKKLIKYSWPMIPNAVSWWIANASDRTIINLMIGDDGNAIYAVANKIPAICTTMYSVFHLSWQQSASEEVNSPDFNEYINKVFNKVIVLLLSISCLIISGNFILFKYVFDTRYASAYYHVPILLTAVVFSMLSTYIGGLFISLKRTTLNGVTTMVAAGLNVIFNMLMVKHIGLFAASLSTLFSYIALTIIRMKKITEIYTFSLDKKVWIYILIYAYFLVMQYVNIELCNYANVILALFIFVFSNKEILLKVIKKVTKKL